MREAEVVALLAQTIDRSLAQEVVGQFMLLRQDVLTNTLGRASPGKFVETLVQILQYLESGQYQQKPNVDEYLRQLDSRPSTLHDGLRICASRVARAMYTLRSKRNIAHLGDVDPNTFDLGYLLQSAQWVLAELVRSTSKLSMQETGTIVALIHAPVGGLVEDFGTRKLVTAALPARDEALVLLHNRHPDALTLRQMVEFMDRRSPHTVRKTLRALWQSRMLQGDAKAGYRLTAPGFNAAVEVMREYAA
jgi:hypothetical protein